MKKLLLLLIVNVIFFSQSAVATDFHAPTITSTTNLKYQIDACLLGPRHTNFKCSDAANKVVADYFCTHNGYTKSTGNSWSVKPQRANVWKAVEYYKSGKLRMNWQFKTGGYRFDWIQCR